MTDKKPEDQKKEDVSAELSATTQLLEETNNKLEEVTAEAAALQLELTATKEKLAETEAALAAEKSKKAGKGEKDVGQVPAHYSGDVPGTYLATRRPLQDPFRDFRFNTTGGVRARDYGKVLPGSWLDSQLKAGVIVFKAD